MCLILHCFQAYLGSLKTILLSTHSITICFYHPLTHCQLGGMKLNRPGTPLAAVIVSAKFDTYYQRIGYLNHLILIQVHFLANSIAMQHNHKISLHCASLRNDLLIKLCHTDIEVKININYK